MLLYWSSKYLSPSFFPQLWNTYLESHWQWLWLVTLTPLNFYHNVMADKKVSHLVQFLWSKNAWEHNDDDSHSLSWVMPGTYIVMIQNRFSSPHYWHPDYKFVKISLRLLNKISEHLLRVKLWWFNGWQLRWVYIHVPARKQFIIFIIISITGFHHSESFKRSLSPSQVGTQEVSVKRHISVRGIPYRCTCDMTGWHSRMMIWAGVKYVFCNILK